MERCHLKVTALLTLATLFLLAACSVTNPPSMQLMPAVAQIQQQAGYHLLSIPVSELGYVLDAIGVTGSAGNQIYTLSYREKETAITIEQGRSLSFMTYSGQQVKMRGTTATIFHSYTNTVLAWTEKGIGVRIHALLQNEQLIHLAKELT